MKENQYFEIDMVCSEAVNSFFKNIDIRLMRGPYLQALDFHCLTQFDLQETHKQHANDFLSFRVSVEH